jgi:hypothetical protein
MVLVLLALGVAPCLAHAGKGLEALLDSMIVGGKKKTREAMGPGEADAVCRAPQVRGGLAERSIDDRGRGLQWASQLGALLGTRVAGGRRTAVGTSSHPQRR